MSDLSGKSACSSPYEKYKYGHLGGCYIKSTLYKRFLNKNKTKKKGTGKTPFFVIGLLCTPILFVTTLASDRAALYRYVAFSILVFSTKKRYSFLKKVFSESLFQS